MIQRKGSSETLPTLSRQNLVEQVLHELRQRIIGGDWKVGEKIPTEPQLVEQLGVARNTVREAVRSLATNGLLDIRQGSGTYVVATSELAGVFTRRMAETPSEQVTELLTELAASGARLAAQRRDETDLTRMRQLLAERELAWDRGDIEDYLEVDAQFHRAVLAASKNQALLNLYADLSEVWGSMLRSRLARDSVEERVEHGTLLEAIEAQNAVRAEEITREDLRPRERS
ncbi:GntR family transcriptional regulator [Glutamicibacter sp. PS]|uniref:FadR/GntR family transcriptional regulator n=1 Tax=Glutamicibacter sp. PS TaxID=3075634 RepID=UPI002847A602|nr:GntR family transcriptional regulator [Glutamicibacter sp. PS]MDR4534353.1 GntR family transcriptional regulator [Glutamicibacter sp. PS]